MEIVMPSCSRLTAALGKILRFAIRTAAITALAFGVLDYVAVAGAAETPSEPATEGAPLSAAELEELVGPVALYPDELLGIVLPASTYPLQIVQGARFLEKRKTDPDLSPDEEWDTSILGLLNYPEVVDMMNEDLDWTWKLGEAVANQQDDVMNAVQVFRAKVEDVGNLKSNDKVKIVKETEENQQIIVIESASPEVIYVPTYQPATVVVYHTTPYPYYYSPYPYYYRPAAGAAVGYGLHWGHWHHDISIDRNVNINVNRPNIGGTPGGRPGTGKNWKADKARGKQSGARPGRGSGARPGAGMGARPQTRPGGGAGAAPAGSRRGTGASRASDRGLTSPSRSQRASRSSSLGGYKNGARSRSHSSRGASSRGRGGRGGGGRRR
jgi:hypothetical protein